MDKLKAVVFLVSITTSCVHYPALLDLDPPYFADRQVKIEYRLGTQAHYLQITNKTDSELFIDLSRCSIISYSGEVRNLDLISPDIHIPPKSHIVLKSNQYVIFAQNIDLMFSPSVGEKQQVLEPGYGYTQEELLAQYIGNSIRLYLPLRIEGQEKVYDLTLEIAGVKQWRAGRFHRTEVSIQSKK